MTISGVLVGLLLGLLLGALGGALVATRFAAARQEAAIAEATRRSGAAASAARAELEAERRAGAAARESFAALSADALAANSEQFTRLADSRMRERERAVSSLLDPVASTLQRLEGQMRSAETEREAAFAGLRAQVGAVADSARGVAGETRALATALRTPHVRGRWGEMQLERVVHLAGMVEHCDFARQSTAGVEGAAQRPDMVVRLAGGKQVVVDAKVPCAAYLESLEAPDEAARRERAAAHARQLRTHVDALSAKAYWRNFDPTPEFVVMFVPGEVFLSAALEADPGLLEHAFSADVVVATPTTLIALLRTVGYAWRQESLARDAAEIHTLGRELHARLATLGGHLGKLGRSLDAGVRAYNETVGSLESRVLVTARRFTELSVTRGSIDAVEQVDRRARVPGAPELTDEDGSPASEGAEEGEVHRLTG
ncbi:DNA recombination protein RmuC [Actinomycetospora termitidis]|uniref:DNA recombination protein RmuC n=1 Tax=Actinomycetospora termitidis TaxID=3053470 RepID=A0ABT7MBP6_9PSEU|nr:DNA recombination protein RmuC [Actinomycetospora sp. Odt1-22]MDL5157422.1 DNA recombination protein RmuC [Actinomycetospora sp. Odt1-22]